MAGAGRGRRQQEQNEDEEEAEEAQERESWHRSKSRYVQSNAMHLQPGPNFSSFLVGISPSLKSQFTVCSSASSKSEAARRRGNHVFKHTLRIISCCDFA